MDPQYKKTNVLNKLDIKYQKTIKNLQSNDDHPYGSALSLCNFVLFSFIPIRIVQNRPKLIKKNASIWQCLPDWFKQK